MDIVLYTHKAFDLKPVEIGKTVDNRGDDGVDCEHHESKDPRKREKDTISGILASLGAHSSRGTVLLFLLAENFYSYCFKNAHL